MRDFFSRFRFARHLYRNNTATFAQSIRSFFEILPFELTSDLYCHTCVLSLILCTHYLTIQMMHTIENHLSNGFTSIAVIRGVHSPYVFVCIVFFPFVALSFNISSNGSPSWCGRFRFCATFWFEAIWFCVLYTPLPQNKHRVITPIQLKWMDCYEMICVNPETTINEMFCVVSLHTISFPCLLVCLFFVIRWN